MPLSKATMRWLRILLAGWMLTEWGRAQESVFEFIFTTDGRVAHAGDPAMPYRIDVGPAFLDGFVSGFRAGKIKVYDDFECKAPLSYNSFCQFSHVKEYLESENRERILTHGFSIWLHQRWEYDNGRWLNVSLTAGLRWDDPVGVLTSKTVFFRYTDAQELFDVLELTRRYNAFHEETAGAVLTQLRYNFDVIAFRSSASPRWTFHPEYNLDYGFPVQGVKSNFRDSVMALVPNRPVFVPSERYPIRTFSPFTIALPAPVASKGPADRHLTFTPEEAPFCDWAFTQNYIFYENVVRQIPYLLAGKQITAYHPDSPGVALSPSRLLAFVSLLAGSNHAPPPSQWTDFEDNDDDGESEADTDDPPAPPQDFAAFPRLLRADNTYCMVRGKMKLHAAGAEFTPDRLILGYKDPANLVSERPLAEFDLQDLARLSTGKILDRTLPEFLASLDFRYHPVQINDYRPSSQEEARALAYAFESTERNELLELKDLTQRITPNVIRARNLEKGACSPADSAFRALILLGVANMKTVSNTESMTIYPYVVRMFHALTPDSVFKLSDTEKTNLKTTTKDLEKAYGKVTGKDRPPFALVEIRVEGTFSYNPDTLVFAPTLVRFLHSGKEAGILSLTTQAGETKINGLAATEYAARLEYPHRVVKAGKWTAPNAEAAEILRSAFENRRTEKLQNLGVYWKREFWAAP